MEKHVDGTDTGRSGPPGVLLTGADYRALGVARSLGRKGIPVWVLKKPDHPLAAFSRYVSRTLTWCSCDTASNLEFLLGLAAKHNLKGWLLLPTDDEMVGFIARHYEPLSKYFLLTLPPWEQLQWACDKRLLHQFAKRLELDQPSTFCPKSRAEVQSLDCSFPVIIKPAVHDSFNPCLYPIYQMSSIDNLDPEQQNILKQLTFDKAWRVEDRDSLLAIYDRLYVLIPPELIMIQEIVPGGGESQFSYAALCHKGRTLAGLTARRVRQYPMDFGRFSTFVETVEEPRVAMAADRLLKALDYTGLVEVEFKQDSRDGRFKLLDVNTRVWGWHTLGARAGVDFSYLMWLLLQGKEIDETHGLPGVGWMRLTADLPMAAKEMMGGKLSLRDYLGSFKRPLESAVYASDDLLPGLMELPLLFYLCFSRLLAPVMSRRT